MAKTNRNTIEYRYYDMPPNEPVLALIGDGWKRRYGDGIPYLHFHNILEIGMCHYGKGTLVYDVMEDALVERRYKDGALSIIPHNVPHTTNSAQDSVCYWEYLFIDVENFLSEFYEQNPLQAEKVIERINARPLLYTAEEAQDMHDVVRGIIEAERAKSPYFQEVTRGLTFALLMMIARENRDYSKQNAEMHSITKQLNIAIDYVNHNYMHDLPVKKLADACLMSETHFRRQFTQNMNMTPIEYINLVRVQKACELMNKTNYSMEAVAEKAGFSTVSTMNRNFRKIVGSSPYHWKKYQRNYEKEAQRFKISAQKGWE